MRGRFSTANSWLAFLALAMVSGVMFLGCARNEENGTASGISGTGASITGDGGISTGTGGQGAGMTGTEGDTPGDNPAAAASEEQQAEGATQ
jgi:hypothetical protein